MRAATMRVVVYSADDYKKLADKAQDLLLGAKADMGRFDIEVVEPENWLRRYQLYYGLPRDWQREVVEDLLAWIRAKQRGR